MVVERGREELAIIVHPGIKWPASLGAAPPACPISLLELTPFLILQILSSLLAIELVRFGATCKEARDLSNDETLWRRLCIQEFSVNPSVVVKKHTYQELYRFNLECLACVLSYRPKNGQPSSGVPAFHLPMNLALPIGAQN